MSEQDQGLGAGKLDDVFETSDEGKKEEAVTPPPTPEPEKGESNEVPPTSEKEPANEPEENSQVPRQALIAERQKRQAAEKELEELRTKSSPKQEEEKIDLFADPEKFQDSIKQMVSRTSLADRINLSREFYMELKPDYVEKEQRFMELVMENPSLAAQMNQSANPAKFAYETASKRMQLDEIATDPAAYEAKIREKVLAELQGKTPKPKATPVPSLATANGVKNTEPTIDDLAAIMDSAGIDRR